MIVGRFLMRLLLVPLGGCFAICIAMTVVIVAHWNRLAAVTADDYSGLTTFLVVAPMLAVGAGLMLVPFILAALIAEAFAIRSWIYHAGAGGLSAVASLASIGGFDKTYDLSEDPLIAVGAGIAAGFAYWIVAGWSAGFWKPVFGQAPAPIQAVPPPAAPVLLPSPPDPPPANPQNEIAGQSPAIRDSTVREN